jgi:ribosome recycling factor
MIKEILKDSSEKMSKAVEHVRNEFVKIRTGKATTSLLDGVKVDYYGNPTPLNQIANISTPDYHTISVQPWDKTVIPQIEKAILNANLGLNPANDGTMIRVPIPALNEERRKEIVKLVKKFAEEGRVAVRNIRRDEIEKIKKEEHISEDEKKHAENEVQKLTDKNISEIDNLLSMKEKEILEV